jgi:hypothetical protein
VRKETKVILTGIIAFLIAATVTYFVLQQIYSDVSSDNKISKEITLLKEEVREELQQFNMIKRIRHRDLILRKENFTQISNYQKYVTPNAPAVADYISENTIDETANPNQRAYSLAKNWVWVTDTTLHGKLEKWLLPAEFINLSPIDPDNPVQGTMASDCEEQAYTLVSILEALGVAKTNVRVAIGEVDFNGETGGHAWVQVYEDGAWFELEATSGPYWDDDTNSLVESTGFGFSYFKTHPYPVNEYWAFFNDAFYYNPDNGQESTGLPSHWKV